jgi:hypothetical protein
MKRADFFRIVKVLDIQELNDFEDNASCMAVDVYPGDLV